MSKWYPDDLGNDGSCILRLCSTMRPNVVLSTDSNHQPSKRNPSNWTGHTFLHLRRLLDRLHHDTEVSMRSLLTAPSTMHRYYCTSDLPTHTRIQPYRRGVGMSD